MRARAMAAERQLAELKLAHMATETELHALQMCAAPRKHWNRSNMKQGSTG